MLIIERKVQYSSCNLQKYLFDPNFFGIMLIRWFAPISHKHSMTLFHKIIRIIGEIRTNLYGN